MAYKKLINHPNGTVVKRAKQLLFGFEAARNLKARTKGGLTLSRVVHRGPRQRLPLLVDLDLQADTISYAPTMAAWQPYFDRFLPKEASLPLFRFRYVLRWHVRRRCCPSVCHPKAGRMFPTRCRPGMGLALAVQKQYVKKREPETDLSETESRAQTIIALSVVAFPLGFIAYIVSPASLPSPSLLRTDSRALPPPPYRYSPSCCSTSVLCQRRYQPVVSLLLASSQIWETIYSCLNLDFAAAM